MDFPEWLKKIDLERWCNLAIAIGVVFVIASLAANDHAVAIMGLAIMAFGFGERFNHRMEMEIRPGGTLTTYERRNRPQGLALIGLATVLGAVSLYRLIAN
jgi:hypothetical protein